MFVDIMLDESPLDVFPVIVIEVDYFVVIVSFL